MAGSKPKYTAEQVSNQLRVSRGLVLDAAQKLGCTPQTIYNYVKNYPTVKAALDDGRVVMLDTAEAMLTSQILKGDTTAIIFYLKTQGKKRGYVERVENVNLNVPQEKVDRLLKALEREGMSASDLFDDLLRELDGAQHADAGAASGTGTTGK